LATIGSLFHDIQKYDHSLVFFQLISELDPFRYEHTDIISNILYVKGKSNELGKLALICFENDKYLPETCCVLGNFYSQIDDHNNSAKYF
jgi:anaphase-promoting complex subunit 8